MNAKCYHNCMKNKENFTIYDDIADLFMHKNIKRIYDNGYEIPYLNRDYKFPMYHLKTQFIPLIAYKNLKFNKRIKKLKIGNPNSLELIDGVKGRFCSINDYFRLEEDFKPSFCFYASKAVAEQLREKKTDFDFIVYDRSEDKNIIDRHAVIRTKLPGFKKPVIIDGAISAIIEEELFFDIQPNQILAVYHNADIPEDIFIGYSYDERAFGQYLKLDNKTEQNKQFFNSETDQKEI